MKVIVGTGLINLSGSDSMEGIVKKIMLLNNTFEFVVDKRIEELKGIENTNRSLVESDNYVEMEMTKTSKQQKLLNDIKNKYVITSILNTIANIADYTDKVCCLTFLMSRSLHIRFYDIFKLPEIKTEFDYIVKDNEKLNSIISNIITKEMSNNGDIDNIIQDYKNNAKSDQSEFLFNNFTSQELVEQRTSNIYRVMSSNFKESFTQTDRAILSRFLELYRKVRNRHSLWQTPYYYTEMGITEKQWNTRGATMKAMAPIMKLSGIDLLVI